MGSVATVAVLLFACGQFGVSVALSDDGNTLAIGTYQEASAANDSASYPGAIYVFARSGTKWSQQAYVKPPNTDARFGFQLALSADGSTLAVGTLFQGHVYWRGLRVRPIANDAE